ncbi:odorant receptor 4-like [Lutzomyia longipalpis]|uniref:odorant receptor 4-like n=1 Tax=Lutzomyia longipalpis TaxID=7200 RepID=UPI00248411D5|nr:odorant receptor 4-like [Lutzomyia longipalpis]
MACVLGGCGFDSFFLESCFFLSSHFDIVRKRFKKIKFTQLPQDNETIRSQISSAVAYHNVILNTCMELQELVKSAVFPFLLFDSILICTCFYTVIKISDISKTLAFGGLSCATIAQLFVLTYSGDYLCSKSQSICRGIYYSNWYEGSPEQRKYLILCMAKGSKGLVFTMGLFNLSLTTLSMILQGAGSYVALLKSISTT